MALVRPLLIEAFRRTRLGERSVRHVLVLLVISAVFETLAQGLFVGGLHVFVSVGFLGSLFGVTEVVQVSPWAPASVLSLVVWNLFRNWQVRLVDDATPRDDGGSFRRWQ